MCFMLALCFTGLRLSQVGCVSTLSGRLLCQRSGLGKLNKLFLSPALCGLMCRRCRFKLLPGCITHTCSLSCPVCVQRREAFRKSYIHKCLFSTRTEPRVFVSFIPYDHFKVSCCGRKDQVFFLFLLLRRMLSHIVEN